MAVNYTLKYKTFDQLLDEVTIDFQNFEFENYIEPASLIKVAKRVNYDLGLRIYQTKEAVIEIEKGFAKLPDDFYVLNFALVCDEYSVTTSLPQGTWTEERPFVTPYNPGNPVIDVCTPETVNCGKCNNISCTCDIPSVLPYDQYQPYGSYCIKPRVFLNCKNEPYELVQIINTETRTYKQLSPIKIVNSSRSIDCSCPNLYVNSGTIGWIKDGYLYTNFDCGNVYINFQGMLQDDDGNLLVPDHDMLNEYYEYALKQRILENLIMNDETSAGKKLEIIEMRYRAARNNALSFVNTPNFGEFKKVWEMNRKAMYARYYDMFKSYPWYPNSYTYA